VSTPRYAFMDDRIVPWEEATVHVSSVGFKFGSAVFEGIRGYWNAARGQMYLFRLADHLRRLVYSQTFMRFEPMVEPAAVERGIIALLRANEAREDVHIMATVYVSGPGGPGVCAPTGLSITAAPRRDIPWVEDGCRVQVSSWRRVPDQAMPMRVKCNANYQNGRLAAVQARCDGYDAALLLNTRGKVAEGPGMCFFMFRDGRAVTPDTSSDILESVTRSTVIELLRASGIEVEEREVDRSELVAAEEAFFCGTAWEITPVVAIDGLALGSGVVGPRVQALQRDYFARVRGEVDAAAEWRTAVYDHDLS